MTLYFSVLPRDFVDGYLKKFCFDYKFLNRYLMIPGDEVDGVAFDLDNNLIALSKTRILSYNSKNGLLNKVRETHYYPRRCVVDKRGCVYVGNLGGIMIYRPNGVVDILHILCKGLAIKDDKLYIAALDDGLIIVDTTTSNIIEQIHLPYKPAAVAITNQIVVASPNYVYIFERDIAIASHLVQKLAVDYHNNIYVLSTGCSFISVFNDNGQFLGHFPHIFKVPTDIAISLETVAVSDEYGIHLFKIYFSVG